MRKHGAGIEQVEGDLLVEAHASGSGIRRNALWIKWAHRSPSQEIQYRWSVFFIFKIKSTVRACLTIKASLPISFLE